MNTVERLRDVARGSAATATSCCSPTSTTLRPVPVASRAPRSCLADVAWHDGSPVVASPRQILRAPARPAGRARLDGATPATELEFIALPTTPTRRRWRSGYRDLDAGQPLQRRLLAARAPRASSRCSAASATRWPARACASRTPRASATSASTRSTSATTPALTTADNHAIYKNGAKEIAAQEGMAITFMAKFDEREGNSCHIHLSLRGDGRHAGVRRRARRLFDRFLAGQLACLRELTLFSRRTSTPTSASPPARSRRRRSPGARTTAPARCASSATGRRCASSAASPGGDVNPYLALARADRRRPARHRAGAGARAGARGQRLRRPTSRGCPRTLRDARDLFAASDGRRARRSARRSSPTTSTTPDVELAAFDAAVTDWERGAASSGCEPAARA